MIKEEIDEERITKGKKNKVALKSAMSAVLAVLGVLLNLLNIFAYIGVEMKIFLFAHTINAIAGVWLGPIYAIITATIIAIIRLATGLGTINAFTGGIPGAAVVGIISWLLRNRKNKKLKEYTAFLEPIGTIFIGASLSYYVFMDQMFTLSFWWGAFAISCIPGCIIGYIVIILMRKYKNITCDTFN